MAAAQNRKPSLLDVLVSQLVDPRGVTKQLFLHKGTQPWVLTTLILFTCTCVVAPLLYSPSKDIPAPLANYVGPVVMSALLTLLFTSLFLVIFLHSLSARGNAYRVFAALVYATAPFVTVLSALLLTNKIVYGDLSLLSMIAFRVAHTDNFFVTIFPSAMRLAALLSVISLAQSLRTITNSSFAVGLLLGFSTLPLLLGSFIVALTVTDFIVPGSSPTTINFFSAYVATRGS
jgi:hypothetical protein